MATIISKINIKAEVIHRYDQTDRHDKHPHTVLCKKLNKQQEFGLGWSQDRKADAFYEELVEEVSSNNLVIFGQMYFVGHGWSTRKTFFVDKEELPEFIPVVFKKKEYANDHELYYHTPGKGCDYDMYLAEEVIRQYELVGCGRFRTLRKIH